MQSDLRAGFRARPGRYAFTRTSAPGTRPLGDPHTAEEDLDEE